MTTRSKALQAKAAERGKLQDIDTVTITIQASENNLQRLAALLLFADHLTPKYDYVDKPMPWEDPNDPRFQKPPTLQLDYDVVRRDIIKLLEQYITTHTQDEARQVIQAHGADTLRAIPEDNLLALYHDFNDRLNPKGAA